MKQPTQKQIDAWKLSHGGVYVMEMEDGKTGYLKEPNMLDFKRAMSKMGDDGQVAYTMAMLDALWLDGDKAIKTDESYFKQVKKFMTEFLEYPEAEVVHHDDHVDIIINGKVASVKRVTRERLKAAERRNPRNTPFKDKEELYKMVKIKAAPEFDNPNDAAYRMPLYLALDETQREKYGTLKKL